LSGVLDVFERLRANTPDAARPSTLQEFLETDITTETGAWTLEGHEPFGEIVELLDRVVRKRETDTEISVLAAEQVGKTMIAVGFALQLVADRGRNVGYFLPTDGFAHKFGRTRLKRLIAKSLYLANQLRDKDTVSQATLKEFNDHFLYILGLESMLSAISIPLDVLINDEVDMLPAENLEWSQGRVAHSDLRVTLNVSAGYAPGAGIDQRYQEGTQHKYLIDCPTRTCKRRAICLEENFPECMAMIRGKWQRVCPDCKTELDLTSGEWVATHPERAKQKKYSFRISSLIVSARAADHIMKRWEKAKKRKSAMAKFRCAELAMPDAGAMQPITDAELGQMESKDVTLRFQRGEAPRYAGMDLGDLCHFYVFERQLGRPRLVWLEEIDSDKAEARVAELIANLGIAQLVIDKKPLTTLARAIAYRFPRIVALQDFIDSSEWPAVVDEKHEANTYRCVKVHRDESLDDFTAEIADASRGLLIPAEKNLTREHAEVLTVFKTHLKNLRKERTIDAKGRAIDRYLKKVANHFGMAGNSARIAELIAPSVMPFSWTPIHQGAPASNRNRWKKGVMGG
jgi:hypothetical protein